MRKSKYMRIFTMLLIVIFSLSITTTAFAKVIDPEMPGNGVTSAWAFNNYIDITQSYPAPLGFHMYELNVNGPDSGYELTFTGSTAIQCTISILDANGNEISSATVSSGTQKINVTLPIGTYYVQCQNTSSESSNQTYRLQMRPVTSGYFRAPGGQRVELISGDIYVDNVKVKDIDYRVSIPAGADYPAHIRSITALNDDINYIYWVNHITAVGTLRNKSGTYSNVAEVWLTNVRAYSSYVSGTGGSVTVDITDPDFLVCYYDITNNRWIDCSDVGLMSDPDYDPRFTAVNVYSPSLAPSNPIDTAAAPSNLTIDVANETLLGASDKMEYSQNGGTSWTAFSSINPSISSLIPAIGNADLTIRVRYKKSDAFLASDYTEIVIPARTLATPTSTNVKFDGFTETISVTDLMEYRIGTTGAFTSVPDEATSIPANVGESAQSCYVRLKATGTAFASAARTVSVPARAAAPNAVYNGSTDMITSVSTAMEYSLDSGTTWIACTGTTIARSVFGDDAKTVKVRIKATATVPVSNVKDVAVPNTATTYPTDLTLDLYGETISGVSNLMEYSTNGGSAWTAITANPLNISSIIPAATGTDLTLKIRYKAANGEAASLATNIILPKRPATPTSTNVKLDGFNETISVTDLMEYRVGTTGAFTSVPDGVTSIPANVGASAQSCYVRLKATGTAFASAALTVSVPKRASAPSAVYNGSTDMITSVSTAMEYSLDSGTTWIACTGTTIARSVFGDDAKTVKVRTKATATVPMSNVKDVAVPNAATTYPTDLTLDIYSETISGVSNLMEYSTNGGSAWTAITANPLNISSMIPAATGADLTLKIRFKAANGEAASLATNIILPKRPATPTSTNVKFDGFTETISVTDLMEYRVNTTGAFMSVPDGATSIPANVEAGYYVRFKATETAFASAALTVLVPKRAAAPGAVYNGSMDMITGVSTAMEYSLDSGTTWITCTGTTIARSVFGDDAKTVEVRIKATATVSMSNVKDVAVPNAATTYPTDLTLDTYSETISGVSNLMEYSANGGSTWTAISANPLYIYSKIPAATGTDLTLKIRYKAANGEAASLATDIILPKRPATPTSTNVKFDGFTETISVNDLMEYWVGTTGALTPVPDGATSIPANVSSSAQSYNVRIKPTGTTFASATLTFSVPARAAAPKAVYNGSTDMITGVSTAMEYSLDSGTTWIACTGTTIARSVFGDDAKTVKVRTKATATTPMSNVKDVAVPSIP